MLSPSLGLMRPSTRSEWVRLRTLVFLRWVAIIGQVSAITVADRYFGLSLDLGLCYLVVGAAVLANLSAIWLAPGNKRLTEAEALLTLLFDLAQLALLLYLTGGLTNPFALLILAPVTISATVLHLNTTLFLGAMAIGLVSLLALFHLPLRLETGEILVIPPMFEFGYWMAIITGIVFIGLYSRRVASEMHAMSDALFATQAALAREQKLTDLGGVVAAAAHELGTPLATIKLTSAELVDDLTRALPDRPELIEDAALIRDQADRCRDILRSMGRAGKEDTHLRQAPLSAVLREAAEPHAHRGKEIVFAVGPGLNDAERQPAILRRPEVIHGLRNLIQNAVDFARTTVWVYGDWSETALTVRILDDGTGFAPQVLGRIGDPFMRPRRTPAERAERPGYEGMGLGLFIAKTLLERSGAEVRFANAPPQDAAPDMPRHGPLPSGAAIEVTWPRARITPAPGADLARNRPMTA
ncbi:sensor histidine kinase RegB [Rhodobaculum claviforme]|uniref:histidine kinase n=1 Tax=Rhodobaculum claviforme TaxID=1549854 RepID=A0A934WKT6_9RHOB|nr:ActS/PrrB/RegB family redox-sensitive histidine kinase [Rhodobaculum claviforme]MBK5928888.1 two-component sensor histidine kinase [Rhodobaculum claviforme]